jgi:hypothetical protein
MSERLQKELELLKQRYPELVFLEEGMWVQIPNFPLPDGWNRKTSDVVFQIPPQYPGGPPYGILVPAGIQFKGTRPQNYTEPSDVRPPFEGEWGKFSWQPSDGQWNPTADIFSGSNLINWVEGFRQRFKEGI